MSRTPAPPSWLSRAGNAAAVDPAHACRRRLCHTGRPPWATAVTALALWAALLAAALPAAAQGTWMQTLCLAGAGAAGNCKASPAWGQTGLEHVQALAATAGPGNLGLSLAKPETLPTANAARAQLAAVMLGYLNGDQQAATYRWFGPVPPPGLGPRTAAWALRTGSPAVVSSASVSTDPSIAAAPGRAPLAAAAVPASSLHTLWLSAALGDEAATRGASWWLTSPYLGTSAPSSVDSGADPYRALRFLAAQCPQLEGKVAPNAWTRCTTRQVPEPGSAALTVLALALAAGVRSWRGKRPVSACWRPKPVVPTPC